jgi:DNA-binding PadR family transcriptional regulator
LTIVPGRWQRRPDRSSKALNRLEEDQLIQRLEGDERRYPYRITDRGRQALAERLAETSRLANLGLGRIALSDR